MEVSNNRVHLNNSRKWVHSKGLLILRGNVGGADAKQSYDILGEGQISIIVIMTQPVHLVESLGK